MNPSADSGNGQEKKTKRRTPAPRPGTMAHLRSVEKQKREKIRSEKPAEVAPPEAVVSLPEEAAKPATDLEPLPRKEKSGDVGAKAGLVIHGAAAAAAVVGGGLAQIPVAGAFVITPIQISMVIALGSLHGKTLDKSGALGVLAAAYGPYVGRTVSQVLTGWIPGVGNVINAATAFVITESIGWSAHRILARD